MGNTGGVNFVSIRQNSENFHEMHEFYRFYMKSSEMSSPFFAALRLAALATSRA